MNNVNPTSLKRYRSDYINKLKKKPRTTSKLIGYNEDYTRPLKPSLPIPSIFKHIMEEQSNVEVKKHSKSRDRLDKPESYFNF